VVQVNLGKSGWISEDTQERKDLDKIIAETQIAINNKEHFDISLQVTIPNEWERLAPVNIGITAGIETTKVAPEWLQKANEMDKVITISEHSKNVFEDTVYTGQHPETGETVTLSLTTPIEVVGYPVKEHEVIDLGFKLDYDFNYLTVCQMGPRKNLGTLIQWFCEENFDQEVGLVVKTSIKKNNRIDREHTEEMLEVVLNNFPNRKCKVYLLHGNMNEQEMNYIADRIASRLIAFMENQAVNVYSSSTFDGPVDEEQQLLADLAKAMTELDYNLQQEDYSKCDKLKKKIIKIENQLNKFK